MNAYREMYLNRVTGNMASMFDFAINDFGIPGEDFAHMFAGSQTARRIEAGEPQYLIGMCGEEIALRVIEETTGITPEAEAGERLDRTPDYWCGCVIGYYQWTRGISFKGVFKVASYSEIGAMYPVLHEADISKFANVMDGRRELKRKETNLRRIREAYGCSQRKLAELSGVSLRSIQMYEQRNKDINKGQLRAIISLARVLGCRAEELLER